MMSEAQPVLRRLAIEGFRGFRDRMEFDLSASVVLLQGSNGTGKTSFFDAIQWLLLGDIGRLQPARMRQNTEHILNAYTTRQTAIVEADVLLGGQPVALRRTGTYRSSVLEWTSESDTLTGPLAETALVSALAPGDLELEAAMLASGLMQQDDMRQVLLTRPRDRYDQMSEFLGLGILQRFEAQASDYASRCSAITNDARAALTASEGELTNAKQRLETIDALKAARPSAQQAWQAFRTAAEVTNLDIETPATPNTEWASRAVAELIRFTGTCGDLANRWSRWRAARDAAATSGADGPGIAAEDLSQFEADVQLAEQHLERAKLRSQAFEAANDEVARLVAAALPLITGSECPICGQEVDPAHLKVELSARAASAAQLTEMRGEVTSAESALDTARSLLDAGRANFARAQAQAQESARIEAERSILQAETDAMSRDSFVALRAMHDDVVPLLREAESQCLTLTNATRQLLGVLEAGESSEEQQLTATIARVSDALELQRGRVEEAAQLEQQARNLLTGSVAARTQVTGERFSQVRPLVRDIFDRLAPHPTFTEIDIASEVYRSHGTATPLVRDRRSDVHVDPLLVLSASHANITALAYFLAMGLAAGEQALPFLLLDDPLQAMDETNVLGFADLCRQLRGDRQVLVSVHDKRFAQLLERKLAPRYPDQSTVMLTFLGWDRSGPTVKVGSVEPQLEEAPDVFVATLRRDSDSESS